MRSPTGYLLLGCALLVLAFILSFFGSPIVDPPWRLAAILGANPARYIDYVRDLVLYSILPPTMALLFVVKASLREKTQFKGIFAEWSLAIVGGIFLVWGCVRILPLSSGYNQSLISARNNGALGIDNAILMVYATASVAGVLWLVMGAFLVCLTSSSIVKKKERFIDQNTAVDPHHSG